MLLSLHILLAVTGVIYTVGLLIGLAQRFTIAISLLVLTITSGVVLIIENPAQLYHVCVGGLVYTVITLAMMAAARVRQRRRVPQS